MSTHRFLFVVVSRAWGALCDIAMAHTFTGFFAVSSLDESNKKDLDMLNSVFIFRKAPRFPPANFTNKRWYITSFKTDVHCPNLGIVCVDPEIYSSGTTLLHELCFVTGALSFGMASHSPVRFVVVARMFTPLDDLDKLRNIQPMIATTGLGRSVYRMNRGLSHEFFSTSPCIYSGEESLARMV